MSSAMEQKAKPYFSSRSSIHILLEEKPTRSHIWSAGGQSCSLPLSRRLNIKHNKLIAVLFFRSTKQSFVSSGTIIFNII